MTDEYPPDMKDLVKAVTRRYFFKQAGLGVGATALSLLLGRDLVGRRRRGSRPARAQSPGCQAADVSRQSEEHHLSLHGGRSLASRFTRLQTGAPAI